MFTTPGCGYLSNWRGISYRLLDEKLGKQGYCGGWQTLAIIFVCGHLKYRCDDFICLRFPHFIFFSQMKPRYSFRRKEIRPGEFQVNCVLILMICDKHSFFLPFSLNSYSGQYSGCLHDLWMVSNFNFILLSLNWWFLLNFLECWSINESNIITLACAGILLLCELCWIICILFVLLEVGYVLNVCASLAN